MKSTVIVLASASLAVVMPVAARSAMPSAALRRTAPIKPPAATAISPAANSTTPSAEIQPGSGWLADSSRNVGSIAAGHSLNESVRFVPGAGGTASVFTVIDTVYGINDSGKMRLISQTDGQRSISSPAPPG